MQRGAGGRHDGCRFPRTLAAWGKSLLRRRRKPVGDAGARNRSHLSCDTSHYSEDKLSGLFLVLVLISEKLCPGSPTSLVWQGQNISTQIIIKSNLSDIDKGRMLKRVIFAGMGCQEVRQLLGDPDVIQVLGGYSGLTLNYIYYRYLLCISFWNGTRVTKSALQVTAIP
jgi:hypothetical protein